MCKDYRMTNIIHFFLILCAPFQINTFHISEQLNSFIPKYNTKYIAIKDQSESYNPDTELSTPQMIRKAGYPAEAHIVQSEDGYLLTIHRIPANLLSPTVFLQHGLLGSSADWIIPGKGKSLAYILADRGYDVWLGNFRGNTYSRAHISLSTSDQKFWDFSWHELGVHDLPAMISYVTKLKKSFLNAFVGHSMGTTSFYVMASELPHIAKTVRAMFALAPVSYMSHVKSPIRYVAPIARDIEVISHFFGKGEFLPQNAFLKILTKYGCEINAWEKKICANSLFVICGFDKAQFNNTLLPVILNHDPAGTSTKTLVHYAQEIESGYFRRFDYGPKKNMDIYNRTTPPEYDLSKISVPTALFYADNDWLASPIDVMKLSKKLKNQIEMYRIPFYKFNHLDFLWGVNASELVYKRLLYLLEQYSMSSKSNKILVLF